MTGAPHPDSSAAPDAAPSDVSAAGKPHLELGTQRENRRLHSAVRGIADRLLRSLGLRVVPRAREQTRRVMIDALGALADFWLRHDAPPPGWQATGIVFSKDRPLQLHALLTSYLHHCRPAPHLDVLYIASTPGYEQAYQELAQTCAGAPICLHREQGFAADVRRLLGAHDAQGVFFLVDDIVFLRPVDFAVLSAWPLGPYMPSLRLAPQITWNWLWDRPVQVPPLRLLDARGGLHTWRYADAVGMMDWNFPVSLDGDVFVRAELEEMIRHVGFVAPNSFEHALTVYLSTLRRRSGLCFDQPRLVNLPLNRVQKEIANRAGEVAPELLLEHWQRGLMLDVAALYDAPTTSVHAPLPVAFRPRTRGLAAA